MKRTGAKYLIQKLNQKLRSRSGASLMMGLLLFLVCAVLGSVVLVAGTAASGRLAKIAEMEQRYYAVNSAAGLLREQLCSGDEIVIKRIKTSEGGSDKYKFESSPSAPTDPGEKLRLLFACYQVYGMAAPDVNKEKEVFDRDPNTALADTIDMNVTAGNKEELEVKVTAEVKENGQLVLTLNNKNGDEKYKLRMTFAANATPEISKSKTTEIVSGVEKEINTETKTNTIQWSLGTIEIVEEAPAATPEGGGD